MKTVRRIASAQINTTVGDFDRNADIILDYIRRAVLMEADMVVFPELAVCGYPPEDLLLKDQFICDNRTALSDIAAKVGDIYAVIGFIDRDSSGNIYNAAAVCHKGEVTAVHRKIELPNYGVFDEKRYFSPGREPLVFEIGETRVGITICEDIWEGDWVGIQARKGAAAIVNLSASPYHAGKKGIRQKVITAKASENSCFLYYTNLVGAQDELVFDGASMVSDPEGNIVARAGEFREDLIAWDISEAPDKPRLRPFRGDRLGKAEEIYNALVLGVKDYTAKNKFKSAVIGMSGGIDSSLTAVIACDALGPENVTGISMPSRYTSSETYEDARRLALNLGMEIKIMGIKRLAREYGRIFRKHFRGRDTGTAEENIQARIRGNILMSFSNINGSLVLTTGNKSELSCGYCTLYGDTAGGFAVLKDVPKTVVYALAEFRNRKEEGGPIPVSVIEREPTAELKYDQKDSDSLPPYDMLDRILKCYVEEDKGVEEVVKESEYSYQQVRDIFRMVDRNEYKRRQTPIGIKITPKAFGKDRRLPITSRYKEKKVIYG